MRAGPSRPGPQRTARYCGAVPDVDAGAAAARRARWAAGRRWRRTGRRAAARRVEETLVVPTAPVSLAMGAFTAAPSGRLLGGCGIWLEEFKSVEAGGALEPPWAQAASEATSSKAESVLKRNIAVTF